MFLWKKWTKEIYIILFQSFIIIWILIHKLLKPLIYIFTWKQVFYYKKKTIQDWYPCLNQSLYEEYCWCFVIVYMGVSVSPWILMLYNIIGHCIILKGDNSIITDKICQAWNDNAIKDVWNNYFVYIWWSRAALTNV